MLDKLPVVLVYSYACEFETFSKSELIFDDLKLKSGAGPSEE